MTKIIREIITGDINLNNVMRKYLPSSEHSHPCEDCGNDIELDIIQEYLNAPPNCAKIYISCHKCGAEYEMPMCIKQTIVELEVGDTEVMKL